MGIDRTKYKATNVSDLKKQDKKVQKIVGTKGRNDRASYLSLEEGENKIRIYPASLGASSFIFPKTVHWLPQEITYEDKETGKSKTI